MFGWPRPMSAIARSAASSLDLPGVFVGAWSGRSLGTSSTRNASVTTARNTGAAACPPKPAVPCVPFSVTTATMAGFVSGAKPMNEPLYECV